VISFIRGKLHQIKQDIIVLDVNGIGYEINLHARALDAMPAINNTIFIHTYLHITENEYRLFGFLNEDELRLFKALLGVSGLGPRVALNVLAAMEPQSFYHAVINQNEKLLTKIPGIGKKSAQRLIFELKDKLSQLTCVEPQDADSTGFNDLLEALEVLGYDRSNMLQLVMEMQNKGELRGKVEDDLKLILQHRAMQMNK